MNSKNRNAATIASIFTMILLVSLVLLSGICFLTGFLFLWQDRANAWVPLVIGLFILSASLVGWFIAQKEADFTEPETTSITDNQGNQIVTYTHALGSPLIVQNLATLLKQMPRHTAYPEEDDLEDEETPAPTPTTPAAAVRQDEAKAIHTS